MPVYEHTKQSVYKHTEHIYVHLKNLWKMFIPCMCTSLKVKRLNIIFI